ncbi:MAG: hypothetical protein ABIN13_04875 [Mucilaginibacter sp.]
MKTTPASFFKAIGVCLFISLTIAACKKDSKTPTPAKTTGKFTFKLDGGAAITVDSANATLYSVAAVGRMMDVYAYKSGVEILEFHFAPKTGTKTAGTTLGTGAFLTYMESPVLSFDSQSGSLNVTTCDTVGNKVEGDFSFVAKQYPYTGGTSKSITEGHMVLTKISK